MACPYFYPVSRLDSDYWAVPPRLPLGDEYSGECRVQDLTHQPDLATTMKLCNLGYSRGRCDRFPEDAEADAVRFHVIGDSGGAIRILYVLEKDGWPKECGTFDWSQATDQLSGAAACPILRRQAAVFIESHRRRKLQ